MKEGVLLRPTDALVPIVSCICGIAVVICSIFAISREVYYDVTGEAQKAEITINEGEIKRVAVEALELSPGEVHEYAVSLECRSTATYIVAISFDEVFDGGLKEYLEVKVIQGEKIVASGELKTFLKGEDALTYEVALSEGQSIEFTVSYVMPTEVGNEAMGSTAKLDMIVSLNQKGIKSLYE